MKVRLIALLLFALAAIAVFFLLSALPGDAPQETLIILAPYTNEISNIENNYYKQWLEERLGYKLHFQFLHENYTPGYLHEMLGAGNVQADAMLSPAGFSQYFPERELYELAREGYMLPISPYLDVMPNFSKLLEEFEAYDLERTLRMPDGKIYFAPALDASRASLSGQAMWINTDWLKALGLTLPQTLPELEHMLEAFLTGDPNGNGLPDEIPLAGSMEESQLKSYIFIMNAFVYTDAENMYLYAQDDAVHFAPVTDAWREGLAYLAGLCQRGLLPELSFQLDTAQLSALANDPRSKLGVFTAKSLTDVLLSNSPAILKRYTHLPPLLGADGQGRAVYNVVRPEIGGVILAGTEHPEAVAALFDLMLSEEAYLISRFGEPEVDWIYAPPSEVDIYGEKATVKVLQSLDDKVQNKHLAGIGPWFAYPEYADHVMWSGYSSDQKYIDARARKDYEAFFPRQSVYLPNNDPDINRKYTETTSLVEGMLRGFVHGQLDATNDADWADYLELLEQMGYQEVLEAAELIQTR